MNENQRALRHGILPEYTGPDGTPVVVPPETIGRLLAILERQGAAAEPMPFGAAPSPCYLPDWLRERHAWGISLQLYELRSQRNWGIGDLADLTAFCSIAGKAGADFVGLNPLHALFLARPERNSPFFPSNRRFLNPLYLAVDHIDGFEPAMVDEGRRVRLRDTEFVDHAGVSALKLDVLRAIWQSRAPGSRQAAIREACAGEPLLRQHALFEALSLYFPAGNGGWKDWPLAFQDPDSTETRSFAEEWQAEIDFHIWLQLETRRQLEAARQAARTAGMRLGLYLDFAVGEAPDGSASWSERGMLVEGVSIGAPPDMFTASGQNWGVSPLTPRKLVEDGGRTYRDLMGEAMRNAGALRIDHVMSLQQLFWIPEGAPAADGAFVRYPTAQMLAVLADLTERHEVVLIGEDLGHVPPGFRERMAASNILSCRILYFEMENGSLRPADSWPELAIACLSTHDLPTLYGWWRGQDIDLRLAHGLIADKEEAEAQHRTRDAERGKLVERLAADGLLDRISKGACDGPADLAMNIALHRYIARTPCLLAAARLADIVGEQHPTNLPGTSDSYPNWRRKLAVPIEDLPATEAFIALTDALARERPK